MSALNNDFLILGNGIGDFGEAIDDPKNDIKEIKNKLTKLIDQIGKEKQTPSYWSITRKESIEFWNFAINQRQFFDKGWICDIPYEDCESNLLVGQIKEEFGPGKYNIILCDDVGKAISKRDVEIAFEKAKKNKKIQLGTWLPKDYALENTGNNIPIHSNKDGRDVLSFSQYDNEKISFAGELTKDICGPISINLFWSTNSWKEGDVEWVVSFQAKNEEGRLIHYSEICRSFNKSLIITDKISLDIEGLFPKGTPYRIIISRCALSTEDTFDEEADLFCMTADAVETKCNRKIIRKNQSNVSLMISNELRDTYEDDYHDLDGVVDIIVERFEKSANLNLKGGFIDLSLLSEDFNLDQELVVKIAKGYLKYKSGFLKGRINLKKLKLLEFGEVFILKRKRWDWF